MAQATDFTIANQSFPNFRTDLNTVLGAINSSNSGTSRPSSATTGTFWLDTSSSGSNLLILKFFDGSDDITFATFNTSTNTVDVSDSATDGVTFKQEGTNFTDSLLVGHSTTGTLSSAEDNTGVGIAALDAITSGDSNTAVGSDSATALTTGSHNVFIGAQSGLQATDMQGCIGIGSAALGSADPGNNNIAIGESAGKLITGARNLCIGENAGDNITSGSGNVIIGSATDPSSATDNRQLIIAGFDGSTRTTWISGGNDGVITLNAANVSQQALTSSSNAVAWDASAKPNAYHLTTENTTFAAPTNSVEGAFIALEINYDGSHTIAFNTVFEFAGSTAPTFTSTDGKTDILVFKYNGSVWQEVGRTLNLSES
tara:strand:+ start:21 stop:1136 length:1116 start_codon:yes stop_codon:yes gene_type:complete